MKVVAWNWQVQRLWSFEKFLGKLSSVMATSHKLKADLVVLPELFVLECLSFSPAKSEGQVPEHLSTYFVPIVEHLKRHAAQLNTTIVGGSLFLHSERGYENVCPVVFPDRSAHLVAKNRLTTYERAVWNLAPGDGLAYFSDRQFGVTICYDSEFPEAGRALAEAGAKLICVPAFTETAMGFHRVRGSCHARAIENQVFVAHSSLVGSLRREPVPTTYGSSAILAPPGGRFPGKGVLHESHMNRFGAAAAILDFDALERSRQEGDVRNWNDREPKDWPVETV
jgi:predicted amidohydrolase